MIDWKENARIIRRMKRVIVHSDINHCYAQIEEMMHPDFRNIPMAVGGSTEKRNGIILAKNDLAKKAGVKTGEALHCARKKCPQLLIIHPDYPSYVYYTEKVKDIYRQYTDRVESFGLDEAWIDLTHSQLLFGDGVELARKIQKEVYEKVGLHVSMGISFNKVFAKMASDFYKNAGFTIIDEEHYQELLWSRPIKDLFMVGGRVERRMKDLGIHTIGDLARYEGSSLQQSMGKFGRMLWDYANGRDESEVHETGWHRDPKSVGNSKTLIHDVTTQSELFEVYRVLSESVADRLRKNGMRGRVVNLWLRGTDLASRSLQMRMTYPTCLASEIFEKAVFLTRKACLEEIRFRSVGISVSDLSHEEGFEVIDFFQKPDERIRQRKLEETVCTIREKYGYHSCRIAGSRLDEQLCDFDPQSILHQIHPVGFLDGPIK